MKPKYTKKILLLDQELNEKLRQFSFVNRLTQSQIVRNALNFYFRNPERKEK